MRVFDAKNFTMRQDEGGIVGKLDAAALCSSLLSHALPRSEYTSDGEVESSNTCKVLVGKGE